MATGAAMQWAPRARLVQRTAFRTRAAQWMRRSSGQRGQRGAVDAQWIAQWMRRSGCAVDRGQRGAAVHGVAEQRRGYLWSRGVAGEVAVGAELFRAAHRAATAEHRGGAGVVRRKTIQIHLSWPSSSTLLPRPRSRRRGGEEGQESWICIGPLLLGAGGVVARAGSRPPPCAG